MQTFRQLGKSLVSTLTTRGDGKSQSDDMLEACKQQLNQLRDEILLIRQQFTGYAECLIQSTESAVVLGKSVVNFYRDAEHSGRSTSVKAFYKSQEEMATRAVRIFQHHLHSHDGLIGELDNWLQAIRVVAGEIEDAERSRAAALTASNRLESLEEQFDRKKNANKQQMGMTGLFNTTVTEEELQELRHKITETANVKESLSNDYQLARNKIEQTVGKMMDERFRIFDEIYVQLLECEFEFFDHTKQLTLPFNKSITHYRKKNPKKSTQNQSRNSANGKATSQTQDTKANNSVTAAPDTTTTTTASDNATSTATAVPTSTTTAVTTSTTTAPAANDFLFDDFMSPPPPQSGDSQPNSNMDAPDGVPRQLSNSNFSDFLSRQDTFTAQDATHIVNNSNNTNSDISSHLNGTKKAHQKSNATQSTNDNGGNQSNDYNNNNSQHNITIANGAPTIANKSANVSKSAPVHIRADSNDFGWMFSDKPHSEPPAQSQPNPQPTATVTDTTSDPTPSLLRPEAQPIIPQKKHISIVAARKEFIDECYAAEEKFQTERHNALDKFQDRIDEWEFSNGVRRNIRSLLTKLPEILWEGSRWKPVSLGDLVTPAKCKRQYQKAIRVVHPDRASQRGDDVERKVICERAFTALNEAWKEFEKTI